MQSFENFNKTKKDYTETKKVRSDDMTVKGRELKELLKKDEAVVAPGAFDAISARLIERVGFPAVYMTGYGVAGSLIGKPDIGLISLREMAQQAENIASSISIPLIADADNGYGNELNVARTVELYERAGIAALQIEDQVSPKKCGHMENKSIITFDEAVNKVRAAVRSRSDSNTLIIARTDARAVQGVNEALRRCHAFAEEGADIVFFEAPQSVEELELVARELKGVTLMANMVETGKTPLLTKEELNQLGYKFIIWPITTLLSAVKAMEDSLELLNNNGISKPSEKLYTFNQYTDLIGLGEHIRLAEQLRAKNPSDILARN
jgi:2,3-dimethylmalate lyase